MAVRVIRIALLTSLLAGCGTVANLVRPGPEDGGKAPFGGVKEDVSGIEKAANGEFAARNDQYPHMALLLIYAADLPFSAIGDVLTWPYTMAFTAVNQPVPVPPVRTTDVRPQPAPLMPDPQPPLPPVPLPEPSKLP